jgi:hypothetical protein
LPFRTPSLQRLSRLRGSVLRLLSRSRSDREEETR